MGDALDLMARCSRAGSRTLSNCPGDSSAFSTRPLSAPNWRRSTRPRRPTRCFRLCAASSKRPGDLGQIEANEYQKAIDIAAVMGESLPAGRSLAIGELVSLMDVCGRDKGVLGARDSAIVALLYGCGLRAPNW